MEAFFEVQQVPRLWQRFVKGSAAATQPTPPMLGGRIIVSSIDDDLFVPGCLYASKQHFFTKAAAVEQGMLSKPKQGRTGGTGSGKRRRGSVTVAALGWRRSNACSNAHHFTSSGGQS